jgi:WD40 repeat protein
VTIRDDSGIPQRLLTGFKPNANCLAWSPDGRRIAVESPRDGIDVVAVVDGRPLVHLTGPTGRVDALAWGPHGRLAGTFGTEQTWLWAVDGSGDDGRRLAGQSGPGISIGWSHDGLLASGGHELRIWPADGAASIAAFPPLPFGISALAWSPDGRRIALGGAGEGSILVRRIPDGAIRFDLPGHLRPAWGMNDVAWDPEGRRLAATNGDRTLRLIDTAGRGQLLWLAAALSGQGAAAFSEAGELLYPAPERLTSLAYAVEEPDGGFQVLTPAEFQRRITAPARRDAASAKKAQPRGG